MTVEVDPHTSRDEEPAREATVPADVAVMLVVPAYNEQGSIASTLQAIADGCGWADAVVVDDGSTDDTGAIARSLGRTVLTLPYNLGIGGAVQTGFQYALRQGYDIAVQVDADGQHPPSEVASIVGPVLRGECDVCVGSRFLVDGAYQQTRARALGIAVLARLISRITGRPVTDPTSGFRAYGHSALAYLAVDYPYDYPEPEALVQLHRAGFRVTEVPVRMEQRAEGRSSLTAGVALKYMVKVMLAIGVTLLRRRPGRTSPDALD